MKLKDIARYVTDKVSSDAIGLENYVTTDSICRIKPEELKHQIFRQHRVRLHGFRKATYLLPIFAHIFGRYG